MEWFACACTSSLITGKSVKFPCPGNVQYSYRAEFPVLSRKCTGNSALYYTFPGQGSFTFLLVTASIKCLNMYSANKCQFVFPFETYRYNNHSS